MIFSSKYELQQSCIFSFWVLPQFRRYQLQQARNQTFARGGSSAEGTSRVVYFSSVTNSADFNAH